MLYLLPGLLAPFRLILLALMHCLVVQIRPRARLGLAFICNRAEAVKAVRMKGFFSSRAVGKASIGSGVALITSILPSCLVMIVTSLERKQDISALEESKAMLVN
jgi:hypothetical protein